MATTHRRSSGRGRSLARRRVLQALYQWQLTGQAVSDVERHFLEDQDMREVDMDYFKELLHGIPAHLAQLDGDLARHMHLPVEAADPVEKAILRMAAYELTFRLDVPYRVVINEAVELTKTFGAEQGHRFVNGVLDKLAPERRPVEMGRRPG
jgi:N utilization substance protein B